MEREVEHNCYVSAAHTLHDTYSMAQSLSHRGKDSTGLIAWGHNGIDVLKWRGPVNTFGNKALQRIFPAQRYHSFAIHGRYKTKGSVEISLDEGHPHTLGGIVEDRGNHRFIFDCDLAMIHNGQVNINDLTEVDRTKLKTNCDTEALASYYYSFGAETLLRKVPASYTLIVAERKSDGLKIIRDRFGVKPGCVGEKDGLDIMASESVAFSDIAATFSYDLRGGSIYQLGFDGKIKSPKFVVPNNRAHCFFEYNYISSPKSTIDGAGVLSIRRALGEELANEIDINVDFVSYIPESPRDAAWAFAQKKGLPFIETFYKVKSERSFQSPTQLAREASIDGNLFLLPEVCDNSLRGKTGIWIDDSIVRGTVGKRASPLLYKIAGIKEVHLASYTPQIGIIGKDGVARGCDQGGVDMPSIEHLNHTFLARNRTPEQINEKMGCFVHYISNEGMQKVFRQKGMPSESMCMFCIGGENRFL